MHEVVLRISDNSQGGHKLDIAKGEITAFTDDDIFPAMFRAR